MPLFRFYKDLILCDCFLTKPQKLSFHFLATEKMETLLDFIKKFSICCFITLKFTFFLLRPSAISVLVASIMFVWGANLLPFSAVNMPLSTLDFKCAEWKQQYLEALGANGQTPTKNQREMECKIVCRGLGGTRLPVCSPLDMPLSEWERGKSTRDCWVQVSKHLSKKRDARRKMNQRKS